VLSDAPRRLQAVAGEPGRGRERSQKEELPLDSSQNQNLRSSNILNKYELIIVAAKEARRLNELSRQTGLDIGGKVTNIALEETVKGNVLFRYVSEEEEQPTPEPEPETQE
jgi:DNA-directed RNA polymerase subunit K/omega